MAKRDAAPAQPLSEQLREIILRRRLVAYRLAKGAGVEPSVITRFLNRDVSHITGPTFDKIAAALGLSLAEGRGGMR